MKIFTVILVIAEDEELQADLVRLEKYFTATTTKAKYMHVTGVVFFFLQGQISNVPPLDSNLRTPYRKPRWQ